MSFLVSHRLSVMRRVEGAVREAVATAAIALQAVAKQVLSEGGASNRSNPNGRAGKVGGPPAVMTGTLRRSIQVDLTKNVGPKPIARVGTNVRYARIHEMGGKIVAKGKYLTIPLTAQAVRASQNGGGARSMKLSFRKTKNGGVLVDAKGVAHWALVRSVTMPKRPFMGPAAKRFQRDVMPKLRAKFASLLGGAA